MRNFDCFGAVLETKRDVMARDDAAPGSPAVIPSDNRANP